MRLIQTKWICLMSFISAIGLPATPVWASPSDPAPSFLGADELVEGWNQHWGKPESMKIAYLRRLLEYTPKDYTEDEFKNIRPEELVHVERIEQGTRYHIRYSTAPDGFADPRNVTLHAFDGVVTREYYPRNSRGMTFSGLIGSKTEKMNSLKDFQLAYLRSSTIDRNKFNTYLGLIFDELSTEQTVRPHLEKICGQPCHVVDCTSGEGKPSYTIWFAHDKQMMILKFEQKNSDGELESKIEVKQIGEGKNDHGPYWYPAEAWEYRNDSGGISERTLTINQYEPNIPIEKDVFYIDFPRGTYLSDTAAGFAGWVVSDSFENGIEMIEQLENKRIRISHDNLEQEPESENTNYYYLLYVLLAMLAVALVVLKIKRKQEM